MLSITPHESRWNLVQSRKSFELGRLIASISKRLADCPCEEIEEIIRAALDSICSIASAEMAGWFFLSPSGDLMDTSYLSDSWALPNSLLRDGIHKLHWCSAILKRGEAIVLSNADDLVQIAGNDHRSLTDLGIRSILVLPSGSRPSLQRLFVITSTCARVDWPPEVVEQCTLLESIFFFAYQRKLAQDESEENRNRFCHTFRTAAVGMAIVDEKDRFLLINKVFCDIIGYSNDELRLMQYRELFEPLINRNSVIRPKRLLKTRATGHHQGEQVLLRKNGSMLSARVTTTLLERSANGHTLSLIMVEDITGQKSAELELNRSRSEVRSLASQLIEFQENERKRLSRELHDDVGQRLSLAASEVALLQRQHENSAGLSERLGTLREELDTLCTDLHNLSHSLHSYKLQHLGLKPALKDLCERMSQPGFRVDLIVDDSEDTASKEISLCLYRVAQEALNNARRHAQTSFVAVTLTKLQHTYYMAIQDLGIGFETSANPQGLGIISMKERLKLVNGQLILHSIPGRGTEIWVAVPDAKDAKAPRDTAQYLSISSQGEAA